MAKQNYPMFCDIEIACGAMDKIKIKLIKSAHTVYVGVDERGCYHNFKRDQIITNEKRAAEVCSGDEQ